jgi:hypothetical protein
MIYTYATEDNEFGNWAFGEIWEKYIHFRKFSSNSLRYSVDLGDVEITELDMMGAWNSKHGDIMTVLPEDGVADSYEKMKELYNQMKNDTKSS